MKFCYQCGHMTAGEPLFCNFCGRSYDLKLCPRLHMNPRHAEVCSKCGSRDFSTPQPKASFERRFLAGILHVGVYAALAVCGAVLVIGGLAELFRTPAFSDGLVVIGLALIALWILWGVTPHWVRKLIHKLIARKGGRRGE